MKTIFLTVGTALILTTPALAADQLTAAEFDTGRFYTSVSVGPELLVVDLADGDTGNLIANSFVGIGGTARICQDTGAIADLCLGAHAFYSLTSGGEEAEVVGALSPVTSETDIFTYGAFVQARFNGEKGYIAPYGGIRQFETDVSFNEAAAAIGLVGADLSDTAVFGGVEVGFNTPKEALKIGLSGEFGSSTGDTDFNYVKGAGVISWNF